jgi:DNA polymerase III delta prime subunit
MFKKFLNKILMMLGVVLAGLVAAFIFYKKNPTKAKALWKFISKDDFENLFSIYDYISMMMPSKDEFFVANVIRVVENAQRIYFMFSEADLVKYKKYIHEQNYEFMDNPYIVTFVMHTRVNKLIEVEKKFLTVGANLAVNKITFPDGDIILESYYKDNHPDETTTEGNSKTAKKKRRAIEGNKEYYTFASPKNFNLQSKIDMFWTMHKDGVYIHNDQDEEEKRAQTDAQAFVIEDFRLPQYTIFGKSLDLVSTFSKRLTSFRENKIQRSYLLIGRAGTGKSTFCLEIAKHLGGKKVMKISAELFAAFSKKDMDFILQCLRPQFVVIDDFDRVYSDYSPKSQDILYFFESLKQPENSHITVFCTVNSMAKMGEAIIRPGRFDEIMVFNLPDDKERHILVTEFCKTLEIEPNPEQITQLVAVTRGFSHAYLKEYCLELKYDPDFKALVERIAMTRQFIDDSDFDDGSEFNIDDLLKNLTLPPTKTARMRKMAKAIRARHVDEAEDEDGEEVDAEWEDAEDEETT